MINGKQALWQRWAAYLICFVVIGSGYLYGQSLEYDKESERENMAKGVVLSMEEITDTQNNDNNIEDSGGFPQERQWQVRVKITQGAYEGRELDTVHYYGSNPAYDFLVYPGDHVILSLETEDFVLKNAYISDLSKENYLMFLLFLFILLILLIGARQGLKTVLSLLVTGWGIMWVLLPAILAGKSPVWMSVIVCTGVTIVTLMLITGFSRKTLSAISGTVIGVVVGGILARYVIVTTRISGLGTEESRMFFFSYAGGNFADGTFDITGLLFAGIVIGSLGAVMDVAMSIASSVTEIHAHKPEMTVGQLIKSGMNIGRDIIGTMSNTLILAYTGSSLPLLLLLLSNNIPFIKSVNLDMIATEIIRALAGSIGLFAAVPVTAVIGSLLCKNNFLDTNKEN